VNNLIETIVSKVVNTLVKKGYSANQPSAGIAAKQNQGMSECTGEQGRSLDGGSRQGKGWRGGRGDGRGKGGRGSCGK